MTTEATEIGEECLGTESGWHLNDVESPFRLSLKESERLFSLSTLDWTLLIISHQPTQQANRA